MKDKEQNFAQHMWSRRFCILATIFLVLGIISFQPANAGETKEYGPLGPIIKPLEPITKEML